MSSSDQMGFDFGERCPAGGDEQIATNCAYCRLEIEVPAWYADQARLHFCEASCRRAWTEAMPSLEVCLGETSKKAGGQLGTPSAKGADARWLHLPGMRSQRRGTGAPA